MISVVHDAIDPYAAQDDVGEDDEQPWERQNQEVPLPVEQLHCGVHGHGRTAHKDAPPWSASSAVSASAR